MGTLKSTEGRGQFGPSKVLEFHKVLKFLQLSGKTEFSENLTIGMAHQQICHLIICLMKHTKYTIDTYKYTCFNIVNNIQNKQI